MVQSGGFEPKIFFLLSFFPTPRRNIIKYLYPIEYEPVFNSSPKPLGKAVILALYLVVSLENHQVSL